MARCSHSDLVKKKKSLYFFYVWHIKLMSLFVSQWLLWGLERSTEDHVGPVGGPVLWQLDWLWQSLGRSEERLDQPCDQQVRPRSVLTVKSTGGALLPFQHAWCYSLRSTEVFNMQPLSHPETCVPTGTSVALTDYITESRASAAHALLACVHFKRWRRDDKAVMFDKCKLLTWHFFCFDFCNWLCFLRFVG